MTRALSLLTLSLGLSLAACSTSGDSGGLFGSDEGVSEDGGATASDAAGDAVNGLDGLPAHFQTPEVAALDNTPLDNPQTADGVALGRALFYEPGLSANGSISCASCHAQPLAFSDDRALSLGFEGGRTGRNSMPLVNLRFYEPGAMFWDERAETLEEQVLMPIQDATEMGMTLDEVIAFLEEEPSYDALFVDAFGDEGRSEERVSYALAQFVRSLVSSSSPYDEGLAQAGDPRQRFDNFSAEQNEGKELFFGAAGCAACHLAVGGGPGAGPGPDQGAMPQAAVFFIDRAANNGLDATTTDEGLGAVTGDPRDDGLFKSPSLRNVAETGPYMHDGRFDTLTEVVEHYNDGVQAHPNLDARLMDRGGPRRLNLDPSEVDALVAFLGTLTDEAFMAELAHSDPSP